MNDGRLQPNRVVISGALAWALSCSVAWAQAPTVPATPLQPPATAGPAAQPSPSPSPSPPAQAETEEKPAQRKAIYDEQADAREQIADALQRAKKENRRVLIQWGANWCGWCHILHDLFASDQDISKQLRYEYDLVLIDIGRFDKNMDVVSSYGADIKGKGVPYLTVLDAEGKALANQDTGSLEQGKAHDPGKVLGFLKAHQAPYVAAESLLEEGLARAKQQNKMVFLHFGAPWCGWCHRLEKWMARPEIAEALGKDFIAVKIDIDRTIGGQAMQKRFVSKPSGIPWFALLEGGSGRVIATSDGRAGNVGFPYKAEEIEDFGAMLRKASRNISAAEIELLQKSLHENREQTEKARSGG